MDCVGFHDLVEGVNLLELGVGVSLGVFMVNSCYFGKVFFFGTVSRSNLGEHSSLNDGFLLLSLG